MRYRPLFAVEFFPDKNMQINANNRGDARGAIVVDTQRGGITGTGWLGDDCVGEIRARDQLAPNAVSSADDGQMGGVV